MCESARRLAAWHVASICFPERRKKGNMGHVSSIYEAFSYSVTHNKCLCAYLYQWKQNSLPVDLSFFNFYTQLLKSGMKNSGRISKHDISLVEKLLCIPMAMANGSSNSYETYFEIREAPIPSLTYNLGAMGKTTSKPPGQLAHQIFTMGGSLWLHQTA